jgi:putative ABC transport system permease protein
MWTTVEVAGEAPVADLVVIHQVNAGYVETFGIRLAAGRGLTAQDVSSRQPVALVNERFVRTRLAGRSPLGLTVRVPRLRQAPFAAETDTFQIVGVVHDVQNAGLTDPTMPELFVPYTLSGVANLLAVRTNGDPSLATRAIVNQVYAVDKAQPVTSVMTLDRVIRENEYATPRFNLVLLSIFATVGLALAIVGVYGVMSSAVAQERHEIGIRMALGADAGTVSRMILARGARLLLAGTVVGLVASLVAGRFLAREVWNVSAFDPIAFGGVSVLLIAAGLQACYWPARRASRTDPLIALRTE